VHVLLVDDHHLFRTGLRALLEEEGFEVFDAASGPDALGRVRARIPDVVLMDINMPGLSGVDTTRQLLAAAPDVPVVMLTVAMDDENVLGAVRAGACGYLLKDAALDDIVAAVHAAVAGESVIAPRVAGGLLSRVRADEDALRGAAGTAPPAVELSQRERAVLGLLATGAENADIATRLYISVGTVKNHVSAILGKLGVENRVQAAVYAIRYEMIDEVVRD
jgi:DNA-binding NarL/FixJ family response regulator